MVGEAVQPRPDAFFGIECSASGKRWELSEGDTRLALALSQKLGLPDVIGRILAGRDIDVDAAEGFLAPQLRRDLPDPSHLLDMDKAVDRLVRAIRDGETIAIFGDYDVDGATSTALLHRFLHAVGGKVVTYIPDRIREGYGPNAAALLKLKNDGAAVAITVDCGITAFDPLEAARSAGLDVIVVDHHVAELRLPPAVAVVNPNRLDETSACGQMAAVGVSFLLVVALNRALRAAGWYRDGREEPDLIQWLDIVALGTVCDVVPLTGVNRALVAQGLKVMGQRRNIGLKALADVARISEAPGTYHAGFLLGPRINAGGRVGRAELGAALLTCDDPVRAAAIAEELDRYNEERREIERVCLEEAIEQVESAADRDAPIVIAAKEGWHPGVIGIVAGRLKERYNLPACVIAVNEEGIGKGSGRSVSGVDLGAVVIAARQEEILMNGGGHKMAAGFTVAADRMTDLRDFLATRIAESVGPAGLVPRLRIDGSVSLPGANLELIEVLDRLQPFGAGNAEPRFAISHVRIVDASVVGTDHVRFIAAGEGGGRLKGIAFRCADQPLGRFLLDAKGGVPVHLAGRLRKDSWQGADKPQIMLDDAAPIV